MRFDVLPEDKWLDLNHQVRGLFTVGPERVTTRVYRGVGHALKEITISLTEMYPHRKSVVIQQHRTPWFQSIEHMLMREVYHVQYAQEKSPSSVDSTGSPLLVAYLAEDHPVSGEMFDNVEFAQQLLAEKVFVVRLSHFKHLSSIRNSFTSGEIAANEVRIMSLTPDLCIALHGARCQFNPIVSPNMHWPLGVDDLRRELEPLEEDRALVESFERSSRPGLGFMAAGGVRLWDRALCLFENVSGEFAMQKICEQLQVDVGAPGELTPIETSHLCRWQGYRLWDWSDIDQGDLSRLVVLGLPVLRHPKLSSALDSLLS